MLFCNICDLISSTHQSTKTGNELFSQKRVHACSIDERIGTKVDESYRPEKVIQSDRHEQTGVAEHGDERTLGRQPGNNEAGNDDDHRLDDVLLCLARSL